MKTTLILGGGLGGITLARELNKKSGNDEDGIVSKIVLFEKNDSSLYSPSLTWLMVGKRESHQIQEKLSKTALGGIEVVQGEISSVDPKAKKVTVDGKEYQGDSMVISLGVAYDSLPDLEDIGHNFYSLQGAEGFYEQLKTFEEGNIAVVVSSLPFKSPVAPYEAALLVDSYLRNKGIREKATISLFTPETEPMEFASDEISGEVKRLMTEKGIKYHPNHTYKAVEEGKLVFDSSDGSQKSADVDLLAYTPKHKLPDFITDAGLAGDSGWIDVNSNTLETDFDDVYAIGDIISLELEDDKCLPKAGVFAQYQAKTVAHNISRKQAGLEPNEVFHAKGSYVLEQGDNQATKVGGDFQLSELDIKGSGMFKHWEKVIDEKMWFIKNFDR